MKTRGQVCIAVCLVVLSFAGCGRAPQKNAHAVRSPQPDTLPLLAVAQDTAWHLVRDTAAGMTWWAPKVNGAWTFQSRGRHCITPAQHDTFMGFSEDGPSVLYVQGKLTPDALLTWDLAKDSAGNYHSVGRQGAESGLALRRGTRWFALTGEKAVGVPMEEGGMAFDWQPMYRVAMQAPANCVAVFDLSSMDNVMLPGDLWRFLESIRFAGEDPAHELSNQLISNAHFDFARRAAVAFEDSAGPTCLVTDEPIAPGVPVAIVEPIPINQQLVFTVAEEGGVDCSRLKGKSTLSGRTYRYRLVIEGGLTHDMGHEGIALIDAHGLALHGDTVFGDVNRDGANEYFGACAKADTMIYQILAADRKRVLWSGRLVRPDAAADRCS